MSRPPRLSDRPFPPYRHIPGRTPHPTRDPAGHAYGRPEPDLPSLMMLDWWECSEFLYAVDLFNACYWWECHEAFEGLWNAAGHDSPAGQCLQAVIQCAVAHLKIEVGNDRGAAKLLLNAARHREAAGTTDLGIDLPALFDATEAYVRRLATEPAVLSLR